MKGREFLYNLIILSVFVLGLPWILYQLLFVMKRRKGFAQRFGAVPRMDGPVIWCHAVSVGEVKAVQPMLSAMQEDEKTAGRIVLSTVTPTGQDTATRECGFVKSIFYFPLDLPFCVGWAIDRVRPQLFITAETEIWPNFFFACFRRGIPVVVVNGRISDGSFSRYRRFRWFFRPILQRVTLFLMQSEEDARRIREIGARPESVIVTGNMKYDRVPEIVSLPEKVKDWARGGFLLVAGSTHAGEEQTILDAMKVLEAQDVLLALVPRHPERFEEVAGFLDEGNTGFSMYSDVLQDKPIIGNVMLVNMMGVLDGFYGIADLAFVGGSLVRVGGHNLLEPAMHGVPVITGPHLHNFRDIADALVSAGACLVVNDSKSLASAVAQLHSDQKRRADMGKAARECTGKAKGITVINKQEIIKILSRGL